ncbi:hypothetical protein ACWD4J_32880 [Streptomyces sp. NPDC002577]
MTQTAQAAPPPQAAPAFRADRDTLRVSAGASPAVPQPWHRVLTLLAVISMFIGTRTVWGGDMSTHPPVAAVVSLCYAGILSFGVLTLVVRSAKNLSRIDFGVLVLGIVIMLCGYVADHAGSDEAVLTTQAAHELIRGHLVYGQSWPWLFNGHPSVAVTPTADGGMDTTYGYPPLAVLLTAPVYAVLHATSAATLVSTAACIVGTVALWVLLPAPWRSAATAVCLGFGLIPNYARLGYPAIVALALLVPVVVRWPSTGAGGRLGRSGLVRAVCLGAACAAQQLPWFLTPFLVAGIYAVRRGELGHRQALAVTARYTATAVLTWLAVNAYFIAQDPRAWLSGIALLLTQGAIVHGQGVVGISLYFTDGSGLLDYYSYASTLLAAALLALFVLFIRRLGPAATVLPWCVFYFATRSQDGYYLLMTPLWLAAAVTAPAASFARAWQPRMSVVRHSRPRAALLTLALLAPALTCTVVAAADPPPLRFTISAVHTTDRAHRTVTRIAFAAANSTGRALVPHFSIGIGQGISRYWTLVSGPTTLAAHHTARYVIAPPGHTALQLPSSSRKRVRLCAFTAGPMTLSSADIPRSAGTKAG